MTSQNRFLLKPKSQESQRWLGIAAILLVMVIYTLNFVGTRYSILNGLRPLDLVALRFFVAGLIMLPYFYRLGLKDLDGMGWKKAILLTCIAGSPYILIFYFGLSFAPASHGAVLNPGIVPSVVFISMVLLGLESFSLLRSISLITIVFGVIFVTASSFSLDRSVLLGDFLLLGTGISWGLFTLLTKLWQLRPLQSAAIISVISLVYLPFYLVFSYDGFANVSLIHVILQAIFQGSVLSISTIYLLTYAVQKLGAQLASLFSPLVPVLTTLLAIPLLGEMPNPLQWLGIILVVFGMLSAARMSSERSKS